MTADLHTERLTLRRLRAGDGPALLAVWDDPEVYRYVGDGDVPGLERLVAGAARLAGWWAEHGWGPFLVTRTADGTLLGECGLYPVFDESRELTGEIELGYRYGVSAWGQGYGREAAQAVHAWARDELQIPALVSIIRSPNVASRRIAESLGFQLAETRDVLRAGVVAQNCWYRWAR